MSSAVTRASIEKGLRPLGLEPGDVVFVHSSLSSFGEVVGGADTVIQAILNVIGPQGTLAVPTFNYQPDVWDPETTPSIVGAITERLRQRPGAARSLHPTHSVTAIGRGARELVAGHEELHSFARGTPLHRIYERGGKILLLKVAALHQAL